MTNRDCAHVVVKGETGAAVPAHVDACVAALQRGERLGLRLGDHAPLRQHLVRRAKRRQHGAGDFSRLRLLGGRKNGAQPPVTFLGRVRSRSSNSNVTQMSANLNTFFKNSGELELTAIMKKISLRRKTKFVI
jgi:hypothetical protein